MEQPSFRMRRIISIGLVVGLVVCLCLLPGCSSPSGLGFASRCQGSGNGYPNRVLTIVSYSPNGDLLAVGYYGCNEGELELWDTKNLQKQPIVIPAHGEQIQTLSFSPNSQWLAYGSENGDGIVRVLDTSNLTANPVELRGHRETVRTVAFGPDSKTLATLDFDNTFRVWDMNNPSNPTKEPSTDKLIKATEV